MLWTMLYFLLALIILIVVHEFGHFIVARLCGIKVLRFSFGFGKVLASWKSKSGTEYAWSIFPLGGYVKMLDESEGEVSKDERHLAFNNQSLLVRFAVVLAGPMFNFLFAIAALWLMWVIGFKALAPMIEEVKPNSIASRAGVEANTEIVALEDKKINSWIDFQYALLPHLGSDESISLTLKSLQNASVNTVVLPLENLQIAGKKPDVLKSLGIVPFVPRIPPIIGEVMPDSPAQTAGLHVGDKIVAINNKPVTDWLDVVEYVRQRPKTKLILKLERHSQIITLDAEPGLGQREGNAEGFLGVLPQRVDWPVKWLRTQQKGPVEALGKSLNQTLELTGATFTLLGRLALGKLPIQSLSGPIGIAQGAGASARGGLAYYLSFLALVSISLGVLNLLPIPVLDGGHLLYYAIEWIKGKPLSESMKSTGMYIGLVLLIALTIIALANDIARLTG